MRRAKRITALAVAAAMVFSNVAYAAPGTDTTTTQAGAESAESLNSQSDASGGIEGQASDQTGNGTDSSAQAEQQTETKKTDTQNTTTDAGSQTEAQTTQEETAKEETTKDETSSQTPSTDTQTQETPSTDAEAQKAEEKQEDSKTGEEKVLYDITFETPEKHGKVTDMDGNEVADGKTLKTDENGKVQFKVKADDGYQVSAVYQMPDEKTPLRLVKDSYYELQVDENTTVKVVYQKIPEANEDGEDADSKAEEPKEDAGAKTEDQQTTGEAENQKQNSVENDNSSEKNTDSQVPTGKIRAINLLVAGTVEVDVYNSNDERLETIDIPQGNITESTYAKSGYQFLYAQTSGGTRLDYVGTYNNNIYYATVSGNEGYYQPATILGENERIQLIYDEIGYPIELEISGNGADVKGNTVNCPNNSTLNKGFNIEVTTARGYETSVFVNDEEISSDNTVYNIPAEKAVPGRDGKIKVEVNFEKVEQYHAWVEEIELENYHGATWTNIGRSENSKVAFNAGGEYTFQVSIAYGSNDWRFNSLQINGEYVNVPTSYAKGAVSEDVLSTGTNVKIELVEIPTEKPWWAGGGKTGQYRYKVTLSNVYEDIVITGGNFRANSWKEIMPNKIEGVDLEVFDNDNGVQNWKAAEEAVPLGYDSQGDGDSIRFRYKIKPGYGNINVDVDAGTLGRITSSNGYYYFTIQESSEGCTVLNITAKVLIYTVQYTGGSGNDVQNLPTNSNSYSISGASGTYSDIFVGNETPISSGKQFNGWKIKNCDQTYWPGDTIPLEDVAEYATEDNKIIFEAQWVAEGANPERYAYNIEVYKQSQTNPESYDEVESEGETKTAQYGQSITIINRPHEKEGVGDTYKGYHLNDEKSHLTITGVNGDTTVKFYYDLDTYTISYDKGEVASASEVPATTSVPWGTSQTVSDAKPTSSGYVFTGWKIQNSGVDVEDNRFTMPQENVRFVAQWKEIETSDIIGDYANAEDIGNNQEVYRQGEIYLNVYVDGKRVQDQDAAVRSGVLKFGYYQYDCVDMKITLHGDYILNSVYAKQVQGETDPKDITQNGKEVTVDNVADGSTVYVYLTTKYNVEYSTNPAGLVENPVDNNIYTIIKKGTCPDGFKAYLPKISALDKIEVKNLPEKQGYTATGWTTESNATQSARPWSVQDAIEDGAAGEDTIITLKAVYTAQARSLKVNYVMDDEKGTALKAPYTEATSYDAAYDLTEQIPAEIVYDED
ncbi:InlB B-repeat-containing protein, partial [Drancourtella massiliensis]